MNEHSQTALISQLRIDRSKKPEEPGPQVRWRIWIAIAVLVIAIAIAASWWYLRDAARLPIRTALARDAPKGAAATGSSLLDATGYVVALREATVSGKAIYRVEDVLVQEGQHVEAGQVIARLDDTNVRAALAQALAQVKQLEAASAAAQTAADDARPIYLRSKGQLDEGLISAEIFDNAKSAFDAAQSAVSVAAGNLAVAKSEVEVNRRLEDDTVVKAPFGGVVTVKNAQPGEIVSPQFSGGGGIAKIVDMDSLEVEVDVNESYINRVHAQQRATITLDAYPDKPYQGEVVAVIPSADRSKATIKVRIAFEQKDERVVPEMGARVSFLGDSSSGEQAAATAAAPGVLVPDEAVQANGESGTVYIVNTDRLERRTVGLGPDSAGVRVVLSGLRAGELLAIADPDKLKDGERVRIVP